jgi:hypothetical protein
VMIRKRPSGVKARGHKNRLGARNKKAEKNIVEGKHNDCALKARRLPSFLILLPLLAFANAPMPF